MSKATVKRAGNLNRIARKQVIVLPLAITGSGRWATVNPHAMCKRLEAFIALLEVQLVETDKRCRGDVAPNEIARLLNLASRLAGEMSDEAERAEDLIENERGRRTVQSVDSFADDFNIARDAFAFITENLSDSAIDIGNGMVGYSQARDDIKEALTDLDRLEKQLKDSKRRDLAKRAAY